jgi:hypothetical protein
MRALVEKVELRRRIIVVWNSRPPANLRDSPFGKLRALSLSKRLPPPRRLACQGGSMGSKGGPGGGGTMDGLGTGCVWPTGFPARKGGAAGNIEREPAKPPCENPHFC